MVFVFGFSRYVIAFPVGEDHVVHAVGDKVEVVGVVASEPDVRQDGVRYIIQIPNSKFKISNYGVAAPQSDDYFRGKMFVTYDLYPRYGYGDVVRLSCRLKAPEPIENFRYDRYLARFGVFVVCEQPKIALIRSGEGNVLLRSVLSVKKVVADRVNRLWHEPKASFMAGLLYGYRGGLGQLNELFSRTGVTHIVAISGYNITIISSILLAFCVQLFIPRKKGFWLVCGGIALFVLFAGASASVVRAGIMGVVVLLAKQLGRPSRVLNVMMLTAVVMVLHNPFILIWDAGFQLSFISTLGLVYLSHPFERVFRFIPEWFGLRESFVATMAAIVATLPLILYQFGRLSTVAPVVNMLILWIIPAIMLLGFVAVMASFVFWPLGQVIAWIAGLGLAYIIVVVEWFAGLSFAAVDVAVPLWGMFVLYLIVLYWGISRSETL